MQLGCFRMNQLLIKRIEFLFAHRTVDISSLPLVIAGFDIRLGKINTVPFNDWSSCIIEMKIVRMRILLNRLA